MRFGFQDEERRLISSGSGRTSRGRSSNDSLGLVDLSDAGLRIGFQADDLCFRQAVDEAERSVRRRAAQGFSSPRERDSYGPPRKVQGDS